MLSRFSALLAVALTFAATIQGQQPATPASAAQDSAKSRAVPVSGSAISVAGANRGYTGIVFGGPWTYGPDGHAMWADYPTVQRLEAGSPGANAGLAVGDRILAVNGVDGRTRKILSAKNPGETFVIRIRRGDDVREITLVSTEKPTAAVQP